MRRLMLVLVCLLVSFRAMPPLLLPRAWCVCTLACSRVGACHFCRLQLSDTVV